MIDLVSDEGIMPFDERLGFAPYRAMIRRDRAAILPSVDRFGADAPAHDHPWDGG